MKVKDVMVGAPAYCSSNTNLGAAVEIMWNRNCGILPIVDSQGKVVGVVTDRDICIALGTQNKLPGQITVGEVTSGKLHSCKPEDDVHTALAIMAQEKVRRLPVINSAGKLQGILSMDDIVYHAEAGNPRQRPELAYDEVVDTLKKVYRAQLPEVMFEKAGTAYVS